MSAPQNMQSMKSLYSYLLLKLGRSFPPLFFVKNTMRLPNPLVLAAIYGLSELYLALTRRSQTQTVSRDRRSLILLWTIIIASLWSGIQMVRLFPSATVPCPSGFYLFGFLLFLGGLILHNSSIVSLGSYFKF